MDETREAVLAPNSSTELARFPKSVWESAGFKKSGVFALLCGCDGKETAYHRLFIERFKDIEMDTAPQIRMNLKDGKLTLLSDKFVWKCCLDINGRSDIADNAFDLLPGVEKVIGWQGELPQIAATGNAFLK